MIPLSQGAIGKTISGLLRSGDVRGAAEALLRLPPPPEEMYEDEGEHPHDPEADNLLQRLIRKSRMVDVVRHVGPLAAAPALAFAGHPHAALMMAGGALSQIPWTVERVLLQRRIERLRQGRNITSPEEEAAFKAGVEAAKGEAIHKHVIRAKQRVVEQAVEEAYVSQAQLRSKAQQAERKAQQKARQAQGKAIRAQAQQRRVQRPGSSQPMRLSRNIGVGTAAYLRRQEQRMRGRHLSKGLQSQAQKFATSRVTLDAFTAGALAGGGKMRFR